MVDLQGGESCLKIGVGIALSIALLFFSGISLSDWCHAGRLAMVGHLVSLKIILRL